MLYVVFMVIALILAILAAISLPSGRIALLPAAFTFFLLAQLLGTTGLAW